MNTFKTVNTLKKENTLKKILFLKMIFYALSLLLAFYHFLLFLAIILIVNLPLVRKSIFGKLATDEGEALWKHIESEKYDGRNYLDIYYPDTEKLKISKPNGIVVFAHGGGWISGYRRQPNNVSWYRYLVKNGFIVVTIDYTRGYTVGIEKLVEELSNAVEFISRKFENGKYTISLMGLSAGGHLALLTASRYASKIDKVVAYYAPCDLMDIWDSPSLFARLAAATTLKRLPSKSKEVYEIYSPINNVHDTYPPTLLVHGLRDTVVPYISSVKMFKRLREKGVPAKLLLNPSGDHGFEFVLRDVRTIEILEKTVAFLMNR
ncbi:MAG: alpha/beta hydrolase family protein [Fervidobacterium sp.]